MAKEHSSKVNLNNSFVVDKSTMACDIEQLVERLVSLDTRLKDTFKRQSQDAEKWSKIGDKLDEQINEAQYRLELVKNNELGENEPENAGDTGDSESGSRYSRISKASYLRSERLDSTTLDYIKPIEDQGTQTDAESSEKPVVFSSTSTIGTYAMVTGTLSFINKWDRVIADASVTTAGLISGYILFSVCHRIQKLLVN